MCGTGIRGRSGFTTDTHREQLTASLPSVSGDVLRTKPLCPPPKHTLLSQRAGFSVSPPSHCSLSLFFSLFFPLYLPKQNPFISVPSLTLYLNKHQLFHPTVCPFFYLLSFFLSSLFLFLPNNLSNIQMNRSDCLRKTNNCAVQSTETPDAGGERVPSCSG